MTTDDLETKRLIIRSTREKDGAFCLGIWLDPEMGRYLADPPREKADDDELNFAVDIETQEGWYPFVAISKETGAYVGTCSTVPSDDGTCWDLGYCVHRAYWRQGYAKEMILALVDFGRRSGGRTFTASVAKENAASNAVLKKLGFHVERESSFRKRGTDTVYPEYRYKLELE